MNRRVPPPVPLPNTYGRLALLAKDAERSARASNRNATAALVVATVALLAAVAAIVVAL